MEKDSDRAQGNVVTVDFRKNLTTRKFEAKELDQKKHALFALWVKLGTVCVLFDARLQGVKVPPEFSNKGDLRLNFCYEYRIADFNFNERAVFATLSFGDGEYFCTVPWTAIYGIQSAHLQQGAVWFESFPAGYDQVAVLGFSEEMCEHWVEEQEANPAQDEVADNVLRLDF